MLVRWMTAVVGIPLFIGICCWGPIPFAVGILCVAILGLWEMVRTYQSQEIRPNLVLACLGLLAPAWELLSCKETQRLFHLFLPLLLAAVLAAMVWEVTQAARTGKLYAGRNTAYGLLCGLYIGLFGGLTALRAIPGVSSGHFHGISRGLAFILVTACCVWATDSAALFVGRSLGKHKLAPLLSPGKTVEGGLGGLAGGLFIGAIFGPLFLASLPIGLMIGVVAGIFGQLGDLFESALKREAGIKDFGGIFPGHGGILDRFDSLLMVAPMVWLLWIWTGKQ